jgi:ferric-dicitrate binding protein FerR (iron transport regulator)
MTKETIIKFLNNRCSEVELDEAIQWANTRALNEESKPWLLESWTNYQVNDDFEDDEKFSILFDKIQQKIDFYEQQKLTTESRISGLSVFTSWLTRAAAILLIPVLGFLLYTLSEKRTESLKYAGLAVDSLEIVTPVGSRTVVHLSDGSEVHLNYGSKLKYPQFFSGNTREVILTGEGYFNVFHNPEKPFIVKTRKLNVQALGTAFNVLAYPTNDFIETTLVNGKVVLIQNNANGTAQYIGTMAPGQHVNYNFKTDVISSTKGNIEKYIAWKDGKLVLDNESIVAIANKLSRWYNVEFEFKSNVVNKYTYSGTFVGETLFQILDIMTIASPVTYKALPRKKLPDGTFSKQKIIISERN